jgi:hypothetical protein
MRKSMRRFLWNMINSLSDIHSDPTLNSHAFRSGEMVGVYGLLIDDLVARAERQGYKRGEIEARRNGEDDWE